MQTINIPGYENEHSRRAERRALTHFLLAEEAGEKAGDGETHGWRVAGGNKKRIGGFERRCAEGKCDALGTTLCGLCLLAPFIYSHA